jgi:hypothetical protein
MPFTSLAKSLQPAKPLKVCIPAYTELITCQVEDYYDCRTVPEIVRNETPKPLLPSSVPEL